ncbi:pathogen-associated molecular patterns-induced protein A70 isoform X2 [Jatropha curcas]|uniref:pathogen-associated molecular patterns-induced protein A70 isoform X2 n=1 Tax=Jatropha curcas TaxID=180498 RepID=UPI0009D762A2|nr:pathogen-associated molecular patterns-induced protein A70 isoform X2 [Jatropha curcas]
MFEESITSVPSIWASMNSWFTPTVLFVFLNLVIGTIYISSSLATNHQKPPTDQNQENKHHLPRSPSVLHRLKSINFYSYRSPEPTSVAFEKPPQNFDTHFTHFQQSPAEEYHQNQPFLSRSPSMLQRLKSINLYNYFNQETINFSLPKNKEMLPNSHSIAPPQQTYQETEEVETGEGEEETEKIKDQEETLDEIYSKLQSNKQVSRSKSDTKPAAGEIPTKLPKKMRKSASVKSAFAHFEEDDIVVESRRPATVKEGKSSKMTEVDDAEVDAKADDFINRFKQQLKLQRLDSIIQYKEMIGNDISVDDGCLVVFGWNARGRFYSVLFYRHKSVYWIGA